jgi:uncharacterized protein
MLRGTTVIIAALMAFAASALGAEGTRVLVYTKNGKGFVHENIAASTAAIRQLGAENGFAVDASTNPAIFTDENLKQYAAIIFCNSNNEGFDTDAQRGAFKRFNQSGRGFVGIHSASGSERQWPYYWEMLGGKFVRHPPLQKFTLQVIDRKHPATAHLGATWEWTDECYYLDNLNPDIHILLVADLTTLKDPQREKYPGKIFGDRFPLSWCHEFDGGRQFYTALGHKPEHYSDPVLRQHILGGILWAMKMK